MTAAHDLVDEAHERSGRLSAADVHNVLFSRAGIGRRGYDEAEVDFFLERVQTELSRLLGEKVALRDEVAALRHRVSVGEGGLAPLRDEASVQAVKVLSAAQQTADQYVADADSYSKRLSVEARERYERTVSEAVARAGAVLAEAEAAAAAAAEAVDSVAATSGGAGGATSAELEQQVAYLRTFSQVCRVQLRSYLEALLRDVELEWGRAHPGVVAGERDFPVPVVAQAAPSPNGAAPLGALPADSAAPGADGTVPAADPADEAPNDGRLVRH